MVDKHKKTGSFLGGLQRQKGAENGVVLHRYLQLYQHKLIKTLVRRPDCVFLPTVTRMAVILLKDAV